jgi:type II secretory pathway pseudopilin PulG
MRRRQQGAGAVFIVVILLIALLVALAVVSFNRSGNAVTDRGQTSTNLAAAAAALDQFAGASGRLPCPSNPGTSAADPGDGVESPAVPTGSCDYSLGTLPWRTLGMRRDDAFDAWGWKISYRVYSGGTGSFTQAGGASMVNCDTIQALTTRQPVDGNGLCPTAHDTYSADFIAGKGLSVTDFGTTYDGTKATGGAAYVLVSHGPSGQGAYTTSGAQQGAPKSNDEKNNLLATGPFVAKAASDSDTSATDTTHFDDVLLYRTVSDLATRANLVARDWPDDVLAGVKFDSATLSDALGHSPSSDTGQTNITFAYAAVSSLNSGTAQDISFATSGGNSGIGEVGGGNNALNGFSGEGLRIVLTQSARKFALTLNSFGRSSFFGFPYAEQVQVNCLKGLVPVDSVTKVACNSGNGLASFSITAAGDFDTVEVKALPTTFGFIDSSFTLSEFASCTATGVCTTTLATAGNTCP